MSEGAAVTAAGGGAHQAGGDGRALVALAVWFPGCLAPASRGHGPGGGLGRFAVRRRRGAGRHRGALAHRRLRHHAGAAVWRVDLHRLGRRHARPRRVLQPQWSPGGTCRRSASATRACSSSWFPAMAVPRSVAARRTGRAVIRGEVVADGGRRGRWTAERLDPSIEFYPVLPRFRLRQLVGGVGGDQAVLPGSAGRCRRGRGAARRPDRPATNASRARAAWRR